MRSIPILLLAGLFGASAASGQESSSKHPVARIAELQDLLGDTTIETADLRGPMPLAKFLAELQARLPRDKKVVLRIDSKGFGKDFDKVAQTMVKLPPFPKKMTVATALRLALSHLPDEIERDLAYWPPEVVLTLPRLAEYSATYEVRDIVDHMPALLWELEREEGLLFRDLPRDDGAALLLRVLGNWAILPTPESIQLVNGTRLVIHGSPGRHNAVRDALDRLRRLADLGVYMNARLYEVDRTFVAKNVAPLFTSADGEERPVAVVPEWTLVEQIKKGKLLLESDDNKIRSSERATFLSRHGAFHFFELREGAKVDHGFPRGLERELNKDGWGMFGTGLTGFSFEVKPLVSRDRRHLRLYITQKVTDLVGIDKLRRRDPISGKDIDVQAPNVRRTTESGVVQVRDLDVILLPVAYQPPGKDKGDKVWVLLARPMIWIEEEVRRMREKGEKVTPKGAWDVEPEKPEVLPPPLPSTPEVKETLQAMLTDLLTNPELKDDRASRRKQLMFEDGPKHGWPRDFFPSLQGYRLVKEDPFEDQSGVLVIRLNRFDLKQTEKDAAPIEVQLLRFGWLGSVGRVHYIPRRDEKRWTVQFQGAEAP